MAPLTEGTVTFEKQTVTLSVAAVVLVFVVGIAYNFGHSTGSDKSAYDLQFTQLTSQLNRIEQLVKDSDLDRKATTIRQDKDISENHDGLIKLRQEFNDHLLTHATR